MSKVRGYEIAKPPIGTPIRWGHWSTAGLRMLLPFWEGGGIPRDLVQLDRALNITTFTNPEWRGSGLYHFPGGPTCTLYLGSALELLPTDRVTILCVRRKTDTTNRPAALFGEDGFSAPVRCGAHVPYSDGTVYWDFGGGTAPNRLSVAGLSFTGVQAWAFVAGTRGSAIYQDGRLVASQTTAITRTPAASNQFFLMDAGNGGGSDEQDVSFFALLNAEWTEAQVKEWTADPFLMLGRSSSVLATTRYHALPTTNLKVHYDASTADDLFKTYVSGGPHTGVPVDGDTIAVWNDKHGANRILKQNSTVATSYANAGGTGNRTATITATCDAFAGAPSVLVNGVNTLETGFYFTGTTRIRFQFASARVIDEAKFYQQLTTSHGTWKWQGSNDGSSWTDIGSSYTLGGVATQTITALAGNTTGWIYYQTVIVSGASSSSPYVFEFEFKIDAPDALPVWRATTPLLPLPCLDFAGGQRMVLTDNTGTTQPSSAIISNSAFTVLMAVYVESVTLTGVNIYDGHALIGDSGQYWGLFIQLVSGVPKLSAYNWDGSLDAATLSIITNAPHVVMMRHEAGTLYLSIDGGAETSVASGNTTVLTNPVFIGKTYSFTGTYEGRIGEIAVYDTALTGTDLTSALSYFTTKWLTLLYRVQATPKATADGATTVVATFSTPPTVGNGLVVGVVSSSSSVVGGVTDNYGNSYTLAKSQGPGIGTGAVAIYYCPAILASGASFAVTVSSGVGAADLMAVGVEVGGLNGNWLGVDQTTGGQANTTSAVTPALSNLTADNVFVMSAISIWGAQTSITAVATNPSSPVWTEEAEELAVSPLFPGEIDTRVLTGMLGTPTSANWTLNPGGWCDYALAAFKTTPAVISVSGVTIASGSVLTAPTVSEIAFDAFTASGGVGTYAHTCTGTDRMLFGISRGTTTSFTYNGVALTLIDTITLEGGIAAFTPVKLWYLVNPASGTHNVVCNSVSSIVASYTGVHQTAPLDTETQNASSAGATSLTTSITTVADRCWAIVAEAGYQYGIPPTAGAGLYLRGALSHSLNLPALFDSNAVITPAGSFSGTTNQGNAGEKIKHIMQAFVPSSGTTLTVVEATITTTAVLFAPAVAAVSAGGIGAFMGSGGDIWIE